MAQLDYTVVSEMSIGTDQLRAIAWAVQMAGEKPNLEMPRLVSQPGLADEIAGLMAKTLFTESERLECIGSDLPMEALSQSAMAQRGWKQKVSLPSPRLYERYWADEESQDLPDPGTIMTGYKFVRINRKMDGTEIWDRFKKRVFPFTPCVPREVVAVCDKYAHIAIQLSSEFKRPDTDVLSLGGVYNGWSLIFNLTAHEYALIEFIKYTYPAGTLIVTH